jgi:Ran GTPase-activating protein (RanGAP) involved in mRNA processing and transport
MSSCFNTLKEGQVRSVQWNNGISVGAFDTEGAAALVEGLKTNTGLLRLDFSYNKTTSSAWHVALAQAKMSQRHSLSVILHSECTIALTIESFCQALGTHPTLEVLDLRGNAMTDEGASALGAMLATNATLKEL